MARHGDTLTCAVPRLPWSTRFLPRCVRHGRRLGPVPYNRFLRARHVFPAELRRCGAGDAQRWVAVAVLVDNVVPASVEVGRVVVWVGVA